LGTEIFHIEGPLAEGDWPVRVKSAAKCLEPLVCQRCMAPKS